MVLTLLARSGENGFERFILCGSLLALILWSLWLKGREDSSLARSLSSLLLGVVLAVAATLWQQSRLEPLHAQQPGLHEIADSLYLTKKKSYLFKGVVYEREDRFGSTRLWVAQGRIDEIKWQAAGLVQIVAYKKRVAALPGDRIALQVKLFPIRSGYVPGSFDYARFLFEKGVVATGYAKDPVQVVSTTDRFFWNRYRQHLSDWITQYVPPQTQGLVEALLVGKRGRLLATTQESLTVSGTFHLLAISGLHLGLVAGWSFFILRLLITLIPALSLPHDSKRLAALLALIPLFMYGSLAGWSLSTQRAAVMLSLYLLSVAWGRNRSGWRSLTLAAILLLVWRPNDLFSAGFQLSFLAVAALLYLSPWLAGLHGWRGRGIGLLVVTLFMQLVMVPLVMYHFHRLTPYGLLGNLLAVPWVTLISAPLGVLSLIGREVHPETGLWLLNGMSWSLDWLHVWVEWLAQQPGAWQRTAGPSLLGLGLFLVGLLWAALVKNRVGSVAVTLLAIGALWLPKPAPAPAGWLHLAILDVGQAQSVVLRSPQGEWSVVDAGGTVTPRFNIGEATISAYLWHYGVDTIQRISISHPQRDHMAGAQQLIRNFKVKNLWLGFFPNQEQDRHSYRLLIEEAEKSGVAVRRFTQGEQHQEGPLTVAVLPPLLGDESLNLNDRSLVLLYQIGAHRFLFPGDIESAGEAWLVDSNSLPEVTLTLAPHHGSNSSSTPAFIQALSPEQVVFSVGIRNQHHFPRTQVVKRWQQTGATLWRTDRHGTLVFQSNGQQLKLPR
ncbi:MAG: DNA internalization-related competence protein ComEC/Rec2 [Magnetococcales bacterium]|nr:DNA internalization-related competence protein ComEC/Rec2 [Magnetococcales bacterium]